MGLIDMHGGLGRVDGGIGVSLCEPSVVVEATESENLIVKGEHREVVRAAAKSVLDRFDQGAISIEIIETFPRHVGLGSGTQLKLAGATAAIEILGESMPVRERARITGRGGTSGIGTAAFKGGGFILDGGHSIEKKGGFKPSRTSDVAPPPVLSSFDFPDWEIAIVLPNKKGVSGQDEQLIFDDICPIPEEEVEEITREIIMKLMPAIKNRNFEMFRESINTLQKIGFKRHEIQMQSKSKKIIQNLHKKGYAAGMSSFGPAVFAIHPDEVSTDDINQRVIFTEPNNAGARIYQ